MINLLSPEYKKELAAARRNVTLLRYVFVLGILAGIVAASYGVGYFIFHQQEQAAHQQIADYAPQKEQYKADIEAANAYNKNLSIAKAILKNEFSYSTFLTMLAKTLPSNAVLANIEVTTATLTKPIKIDVNTKSYQGIIDVKDAFQRSQYFKDTKIITAESTSTTGAYTFRGSLMTTFDINAFNKAQKEGAL